MKPVDEVTIGRAPDGRGFRLVAAQFVPRARDEIFEFFSDARQLQAITPPWLHFTVLTPAPIHIRTGTLIDYRLRLRGIPLRWQSRISVWEPPLRFVDEQLRGPYRYWRHEHTFEEQSGGTLCRDTVDYDVLGGRLVNWLIVERDIRKIFAFRQQSLSKLLAPTANSE
jgi:ligand-binding SRPBCC domain-containing protein